MKVRPRTIAIHILAWSIALIWTIPFISVLMSAIRPTSEILDGWWLVDEFNPTLSNFVEVMTNPIFPLASGMANSFVVAIPATFIPMFVAALAGYGFARFSFPVRDYLFLTIVIIMAIPQMMVAVPLFGTMVSLNLVNTRFGLMLVHSAWGLPWIILFMRNYFGALPIEIEEAARVDGASDFKVFYKIVLPMALPALASVLVLQFMWVWNDFFFAQILIGDPTNYVATQMIPRLAFGQYHRDWGLLTASSLMVMLVPVLIYVFLQKYYIRGMIGWTIKG
ncbi:MAG: carbohydrate ABC transporter permease [Thermoplasmata archaeon]